MQTVYDTETPVGIEGQKIEAYPSGIVTGIAEGGAIPVGRLVVMDTTAGRADKSARLPAATGDVTNTNLVLGFSMLDPTYPQPPYAQYKTFPIMRKGRILLYSETAIAKGTRPFVRFAAGGTSNLGAIRADADTATAVAAPYAVVITPVTTAGGLCVVEINL
jgi:hypothetical protein